MPRGKLHYSIEVDEETGEVVESWKDSHGGSHCQLSYIYDYDDEDDEDSGERLSASDAADIWASNGMDEDYTFGYDEDELKDALNRK